MCGFFDNWTGPAEFLVLAAATWKPGSFFFREVLMQSTKMNWITVAGSGDVISGILNWVCPGCGGRMGGPGKEFKCQGECLTDWRLIWEQNFRQGR